MMVVTVTPNAVPIYDESELSLCFVALHVNAYLVHCLEQSARKTLLVGLDNFCNEDRARCKDEIGTKHGQDSTGETESPI